MGNLLGLGKVAREQIVFLLEKTQGTISVKESASVLGISRQEARKRLARLCKNGWLSRIKRGVYIAVPLASATSDISLEDPWMVAEKLYNPCYIGGWSAGEYWGLTEQVFRTIVIKTTQKPRNRHPKINGTTFLLVTMSSDLMFGLKVVWRGQVKVFISDPTRTILDFLNDPKLGGGIRTTMDMFNEYLSSEHKNLPLLMDYAARLKNGAVFKRLGFLMEYYAPEELDLIDFCQRNLTKGKVKLDPKLTSEKLITKWCLWVPKNWKR